LKRERPPAIPLTASLRFGSPGRTRTSDKAVNSRLLYQLSYRGSEHRRGESRLSFEAGSGIEPLYEDLRSKLGQLSRVPKLAILVEIQTCSGRVHADSLLRRTRPFPAQLHSNCARPGPAALDSPHINLLRLGSQAGSNTDRSYRRDRMGYAITMDQRGGPHGPCTASFSRLFSDRRIQSDGGWAF
jgi:hypothetical protein